MNKPQKTQKLTRRDFLKTSALIVAGSALAACAQQPTPATLATEAPTQAPAPAGKLKLTYAWPFAAGQEVSEELVKMFNEQSSTIEVEYQVIPQDQVLPKFTTAFTSGAGPDCLAMSPAWLATVSAAGWVEDLEGRLASSNLANELLPVGLAQGRMYKNTLYMLPSVVDTYPMFYNKTMFSEAGLTEPPKTLDEFHEYAAKMTDAANNRYGYFQLGGPAWSFQQWSTWMLAQGGIGVDNTLYEADKKCIFRRPEGIAGVERWLSLYRDDKVSPEASATATFNDAANAFNTGQIGMAFGFLGYITNFRNGLGDDNFGVASPPTGPAGEFIHYGVNGYCINAASPNKDASWEFIQFLLQPEMNVLLNKQWGAIPAVEAGLSDEYLNHPHFIAPKEMVQKSDTLVHTPRQLADWGQFFQTYQTEEIQKALLSQQTAEEFADHVSTFLEEALAKES